MLANAFSSDLSHLKGRCHVTRYVSNRILPFAFMSVAICWFSAAVFIIYFVGVRVPSVDWLFDAWIEEETCVDYYIRIHVTRVRYGGRSHASGDVVKIENLPAVRIVKRGVNVVVTFRNTQFSINIVTLLHLDTINEKIEHPTPQPSNSRNKSPKSPTPGTCCSERSIFFKSVSSEVSSEVQPLHLGFPFSYSPPHLFTEYRFRWVSKTVLERDLQPLPWIAVLYSRKLRECLVNLWLAGCQLPVLMRCPTLQCMYSFLLAYNWIA